MQSMRSRDAAGTFLSRILVATLAGLTPQEFAEQELRGLRCKWCRDGLLASNGQHDILGVIVPCDATQREEAK